MKQLFVAIPICGFLLIFIMFFFISELKPSEKIDECVYASMSNVNGCIIHFHPGPLRLDVCLVSKHDGQCPIIIPETEKECLDLYETYKFAFEISERSSWQFPASYLDYKEERCDV